MKTISATSVKQNFGSALAAAAREPVAIERHGKTVAVLVPPGMAWLAVKGVAAWPDVVLEFQGVKGFQPFESHRSATA